MDSRTLILANLRIDKRKESRVPLDFNFENSEADLLVEFCKQLKLNKVEVHMAKSSQEFDSIMKTLLSSHGLLFSCIREYSSEISISSVSSPQDLDQVKVCLVAGKTCVGENGAIFISDDGLPHRALPFIASHLIIVVESNKIVPTMLEAYSQVDNNLPYSVFIAGPSKTADIEQSLVIGAHGAESMTVVIKLWV